MNKLFFIEEFKSKNIFKSLPYCLIDTQEVNEQIKEFKIFTKEQLNAIKNNCKTYRNLQWKDYKKVEALHQSVRTIIDSLYFTHDFKKEQELIDMTEDLWHFLAENLYNDNWLRQGFNALKNNVDDEKKKNVMDLWLTYCFNSKKSIKNKNILSLQEKITKISTQLSENITASMNSVSHCYVVSKKEIGKLKGITPTLLRQGYKNAIDMELQECVAFPPQYYLLEQLLECLKISQTRKELYLKYLESNTKKEKFNNEKLLTELIKSKQQFAILNNKENYCDLVAENYLIKNKNDIYYFMEQTIDHMTPFYNKTLKDIEQLAQTDDFKKLNAWDVQYFKARLKKLKFDSIEREYKITTDNALEQIIKIIKEKFNISITPCVNDDINKLSSGTIDIYTIKDNNTGKKGHLIFDIYHDYKRKEGAYYQCDQFRPNFSQGSTNSESVFTIRGNFAKNKKSQISFSNISCIFHELGHAMHGFYSQYDDSMTSTLPNFSWDLIELPSQFMEQFMYDADIVSRFMIPKKGGGLWKTKQDALTLIEANLWLDNFFYTYKNLHIDLQRFELFNTFKPHSNKPVGALLKNNIRNQFYFNPNNDYFLCDQDYKTDYGPTKYVYLLNDIMAHTIYKDLHKNKNISLDKIYRKIFSSTSNVELHNKLKELINFSKLDIENYLSRGQKFDFFKPVEPIIEKDNIEKLPLTSSYLSNNTYKLKT